MVSFEIMTNFQDETQNLCTFKNLIAKEHMTYWGNYKYNIFQKTSFENPSLGKHVFWGKRPQKGQ